MLASRTRDRREAVPERHKKGRKLCSTTTAFAKLIDRVRARWRALVALPGDRAGRARGGGDHRRRGPRLARWTDGAPVVLMVLAAAALVLAVGGLTWGVAAAASRAVRQQVARYIEERAPSLDDRLVTAVDVAGSPRPVSPGLADAMLADAARRDGGYRHRHDRAGRSAAPRRVPGRRRRAGARDRPVRVARSGAAGGRRRVADALSRAGRARGHARQRENQGRLAARDSGAACRQPRAGHRAGADRGRRSLARQRDDERRARLVPAGDAVGQRAVQVPRRRRRGDVADLRDRRRASAARDAHRRRLHVSRRPAPRAADRDRQRRHLRAGRHRRARARVHRSARRERPDDARRRQADRAGRRQAERALRVAEGDRRQLVSRRARRSRRHRQPRRHRVFHPHARGSSAGRAHAEAGDRSFGDAARGSRRRGAGRRRLRHRSARSWSTRCAAARRTVVPLDIARKSPTVNGATRCSSRISTCSRATSSPTTCARAT